jgi:hypothetical protein
MRRRVRRWRGDEFMNVSLAGSPAAALFRAANRRTLGDVAGECWAIAVLTPLLLVVTFWNGFPLIFYDTGAYLLEGLGWHFLVERSPVYSLFLRVADAGLSLWTVVVLQAIATAFVMVQCARVVAPRLGIATFLALCAALVVATGLPWYVGEVEPDCFAAVTVIAVYLLAFHANDMGKARTGALFALGGCAAAAHTSHLLLAAGLWLSLALYRAIRSVAKTLAECPKPALGQPALVIGLAFSLVLASNFLFTGQIFVSRAGPSFLFARLLQDRVVTRLLDETCPGSGYRLCAYREILPPTANAWLWASYSPFFKLGGFEGTRDESARIVRDSLLRYPLLNAKLAVADGARQFLAFRTGDQVEPQQWALRGTLAHFLPSQMDAYLSARQQQSKIDFRIVNRVDLPVGYLSLLVLAALIGFALWSSEWGGALFLATMMLALLGNAFICGALSNPHDRYQSRLIWLAPFAASLVAAAWNARSKGRPRKLDSRASPDL